MNRLKAIISGTNFAYLLILALVVKSIVSDVSYAAFLLTIPVLGFESYKLYLKSKAPNQVVLDAEMRKELDNIKSKLNANAFEKGLTAASTPNKRYF